MTHRSAKLKRLNAHPTSDIQSLLWHHPLLGGHHPQDEALTRSPLKALEIVPDFGH
jgi:hypothetical protein